MKIASVEIMNSIDRFCIDTLKIPSIVLMENAALKVLKNIEINKYSYYTVVCGKGKNGGDGFAIARHLYVMGKNIEVFLVAESDSMSADTRLNYDILKNLGVTINKISNMQDIDSFRETITQSEITIDAIFGTGLKHEVEGVYDLVISIINENSRYTLSVDLPSGISGNSGEPLGNCIRADKTVTFQLYKRGFLNYGTDKYCGEIIVEDIGIPDVAIDKFHNREFIMESSMVKDNLIKREKYGHKGDYGKVFVVAGSKGFSGAAYISTTAAIRTGAGLVAVCCSEDIVDILSEKLTEAMTLSFKDKEKIGEWIKKSDSIAIGPGMGNNENTFQLVKKIINEANCPIVIDADGINVLKQNISLLHKRKKQIIITPHLGEMSRLLEIPIEEIKKNRIEVAKRFAKENGVIVLLKGYNTIITDGETIVINPTGNSAMASGGMGDCLTGIIASLLGQGYVPIKAAAIGAYLHGYCGEKLSRECFSVNATDILNKIPFIMKEFQ